MLLVPDMNARATADEALDHEWMSLEPAEVPSTPRCLPESVVNKFCEKLRIEEMKEQRQQNGLPPIKGACLPEDTMMSKCSATF